MSSIDPQLHSGATSEPEWLVPGAEAAILRDGRATQGLERVTIERVLKRDVVLSNGDRFTKPTLSKSRGGSFDGRDYLLPSDHPRVVAARERIRFRKRQARLRSALSAADDAVNHARDDAAIDAALIDLREALDFGGVA